MQYSRLGNSGLVISRLSFGVMTFGSGAENDAISGVRSHDKEKGYDLIDRLKEIGHRYQASVAQVALAWILSKAYVTTILLGASKLAQLEDNLRASNLQIAAEDIAALDVFTAPAPVYLNWFQKVTLDATANDALKIGSSQAG
jgi:aryl-alcohol dehydrogenase-like predicted oxidoreductase